VRDMMSIFPHRVECLDGTIRLDGTSRLEGTSRLQEITSNLLSPFFFTFNVRVERGGI